MATPTLVIHAIYPLIPQTCIEYFIMLPCAESWAFTEGTHISGKVKIDQACVVMFRVESENTCLHIMLLIKQV